MNYIGDFAEDSTVRIVLSTNNASGAPVAPSSAFEADDFRIYKNGSATQKTTTNGITITSPFDSVTGLHTLEIDTSNDTGDTGFWTTAADYWVVAVPDETVDSQTVVQPIAAFSIQNRYMRGTDGANTTAPPTASDIRTAVGLASANLDTQLGDIPTVSEFNARTIPAADYATSAQATAIETDTQDIQTRLPAALVSGRMDSNVGAMAANTITASAVASDAVTEIQSGLATSTGVNAAFTEIKGATWSSTTDTLEAIRDAAGSGGTSIMVTPVVAQVPVRVRDTDIETYIGDLSTIRIGIFSGEDAVDLSGFGDLEVCVQAKDGTDLDFVEMADLTIDGTDSNYVSWDPAGPSVATVRRGKWSLRKTSNKQVIAKGAWIISDAALEDTGS